MHSALNRISTITSSFVTVLLTLMTAIALSGMVYLHLAPRTTPSISVINAETKIGRLGYYYDYGSNTELATMSFDLEADLSSLFNWNTKLLFVYLTASYSKPKFLVNTAVIWDDIIHTKEDALISIQNKKSKYFFTDIEDKLVGLEGNLTLQWNIVPWMGKFDTEKGSISAPFRFKKKIN